jgi:hypothetical protein
VKQAFTDGGDNTYIDFKILARVAGSTVAGSTALDDDLVNREFKVTFITPDQFE